MAAATDERPGPAPAGRRASWALENDDLRRRATAHGPRRPFVLDGRSTAMPSRSTPRRFSSELSPGDVVVMDNLSSHKGPNVRALIERQALSCSTAALQSRLQSNRERLCQTKGAPPEGCRADHRGPLEGDRPAPRNLHPIRVRQLLRRRGVRPDSYSGTPLVPERPLAPTRRSQNASTAGDNARKVTNTQAVPRGEGSSWPKNANPS